MTKSENKVIKSGIWYTISNFLVRGIGFITTPIFTRLLTQEEFGAFNNYTSWISILAIVVPLNLESTLISARYEYEDKLDEYISSVMSLGILSTLVWWLVSNCFMEQATNLFGMDSIYVNSMFAYLIMLPAINMFQTRERFFYRYKVSVALSMLLSVGASVISVILVVFMENSLAGRVLGMVLPYVCIGLVIIIYVYYKGKCFKTTYWKQALKIALPFIPHMLSLTVLNLMDRVMITKMCGERDTALYSLAYNVAAIITMLLSSLNGAIAPWIGEKLSQKDYRSIRSASKGYILLFVYFAIGIMLLAPEVLLILGGEAYIDAKWIMVPVALGCICQFCYTLFVNVEQFEKKTLGMAFASMSAAVINLVLNAWLIPQYGYIAAAYTTLIGYLWLLIVHMYLVYRLNLNEVYSYRFIFMILFVVAIISGIIYLLYTITVVRYLVILAYGLVTLGVIALKRNEIIGLLKHKS